MTQQYDSAPAAAPAPLPRMLPFYWSLQRELWEHRSVYIAPLSIAAIALFGFLLSTFRLAHIVRTAATVGSGKIELLAIPYIFVAVSVLVTGLLVGMFYSLAALHGERRDRSILFWKSLPVSDLTTVLAKAAVPILVLPTVIITVIFAAQLIMLGLSTLIVLANGIDPRALWAHMPVPHLWLELLRGLPFIALWYAPLFAWLLLVSAWARRAPFLWAVATPLAPGLVEQLALGTHAVWSWLGLRMVGAFAGAYDDGAKATAHHASHLDPGGWTSPHIWIGLVLATAFLAAAVRLRRSREPI